MPLAALVHELGIPTVGVRHLSTKEAKGGALAKVFGSTAWIGVPRVVLAAVADSSDPALVHVQPIKGNRVPRGEAGRRFRLEGRMLPDFTESVVCAVEDGASDVDVDSELAGKTKRGAVGERIRARNDPRHAAGFGWADGVGPARRGRCRGSRAVAAKTVKNLRSELREKGWLRSVPDKDEHGEIQRWYVALTNAAPDPVSRAGEWNSRDLDYLSQIRDVTRSLDPDIPGTPARNGTPPDLPPDAPEWERAYWQRKTGRSPE